MSIKNSSRKTKKKANYRFINQEKAIINPITMFILIILLSILSFIGDFKVYIAILIISLSILFVYSVHMLFKHTIIIIILIVLSKLIVMVDLGLISGALVGMLSIIIRFYPIFIIGAILVRSSTSAMMSTFRLLRIPSFIAISIIVGLRFLGEIRLRIKQIKIGMKTRDLSFSIIHPIRTFEIYLIPLIYKSLSVSETISSSIISRGIDYDCAKTSYTAIKFTFFDFFFLAISVGLYGCLL